MIDRRGLAELRSRPAALLGVTLALCLLAVAGTGRNPHAGPKPAGASTPPIRVSVDSMTSWHFPVGERMSYSVAWEGIRLGEGSLEVEAIDTLDRRQAYRVALEMEGGPPFYRVEDRMVSWIQPDPYASLRFAQKQKEGNYRRDRRIDLDQESLTYTRYDLKNGVYVRDSSESEVPIPPGALDEIAYLYLVRLLPLEVGQRYEFDRYFKEDGNPATVEVLRRDEIRVPAGRFRVLVLRPGIRTDGLFSEGGQAEVFVTDDERRVPVRLTTSLSVGSGHLFLTDYEPGESGALIESGRLPERAEGEEDR